jgi:hypothetical protein
VRHLVLQHRHREVRHLARQLDDHAGVDSTRHGIPRKDVDYAVEGYADDMLRDAIYNR